MTHPLRQSRSTHAARGTSIEGHRAAIPLLLVFCALIYLPRLGAMPLWEPDEPRYAEVAREMLESGDFVTSRCDYVRYLKKPPLLFWMTAASFALVGNTEFAARLPSALAGIGSAVVCYVLARSMFGGLAGLFAGGILATSLLQFALARVVRFDGPLTLLVSLALLLFWLGHQEPDPRRAGRVFLAMYPVLALAMLVKGPVGPGLVGLIVFIYLLATRNLRMIARMQLPLGLIIFAAIAAPWFVLAERANPGAARFFLLGENVSRFTTGAGGHPAPVWFYVPVLLVGMFPWTGLLPAAIWHGIRCRRDDEPRRDNAAILCLTWAAVTVGFFSLSGSKVEAYVLPAWPALAALSGSVLARFAQGQGPRGAWRWAYAASLGAVLALVLAAGIGGTIFVRSGSSVPSAAVPGLTAALLVPATISGVLVLAALFTRRVSAFVLMTAALGGLMVALAGVMVSVGAERSLKPLALRAKAELRRDDLLVAYQCIERDLCYYAEHPLVVVGGAPSEFDFDRDGARRDDMWVPEPARMLDLLRSAKRVLAFSPRRDYGELRSDYDGPLYVLDERNGIILFSNRPPRYAGTRE